jgi:ABC-type multidrug transport system fused ATPase/permease subunit
MKGLRLLWQLFDPHRRRQWVLLQGLSLIMALTTLASVASVLPFFLALTSPGASPQSAHAGWLGAWLARWNEGHGLVVLGVALVTIVAIANAINLAGFVLMARFAHSVADELGAALLRYYLRCDYGFHAQRGGASLTHNVLYSASRIAAGIVESGLIAVTNGITAALILVGILCVSPIVGGIALVLTAGSYLAIYSFARRRLLNNGRRENAALDARSRIASESLALIKQVLLQGADGYFHRRFVDSSREISAIAIENHALASMPRYVIECVLVAGLVAAGLAGIQGAQFAQLSFLGFAAYRLLPAFQQLFAALLRLRANRGAIEEIVDDLVAATAPPRVRAPDQQDWAGAPRNDIELAHVTFSYANSVEPALRDVNLRIPAQAMVGIVGENGAGKSTLVDIILGLLVPGSGVLRVDGREIDGDNRAAWRSRLAYVPQEVLLIDASIRENIAFGVPAEAVDEQRVREVLRCVRLESLVGRAPRSLETRVGDRGSRLSGGQRQRVGIARALYGEASVIVLDEGTSALDDFSEREILELLCALRGRCTVLLIAHRAAVIRDCDMVVRLAQGRVVQVEHRSHSEWSSRIGAVE